MNKRFIISLQFTLIFVDLVAISSFFFGVLLFFRNQMLIGKENAYSQFGLFTCLAWLTIVLIFNVYKRSNILSFEKFIRHTLESYLYVLLLVVIYLFFMRMTVLSRVFIITVLSCLPAVFLFNRFLYLIIYQYFMSRDYLVSRVLIIGYNSLSKRLVNYLEKDGINKKIVGYCEEYEQIDELSVYPILSNINDVISICDKHEVSEIYSTIAPEQNSYVYDLMHNAEQNCIRFKIVPDMGFFLNRKMHIDNINGIPVILARPEPMEDLSNRIKKRLFDIAVSSLVIVFILSWLIPLVGLLILIESRGKIFFVQQRTGKNNKIFRCFKFRSMVVNNSAHLKQASRNDSRITGVGSILRKTSLDEFPQFINVLKGEMSIVGPRPHMLKHTDEYSRQIGKYMVRQFVKPGITGWAQVNGFRGETTDLSQMNRRVENDLWYMENWSIMLDIKIIFMTVINAVRGERNAF